MRFPDRDARKINNLRFLLKHNAQTAQKSYPHLRFSKNNGDVCYRVVVTVGQDAQGRELKTFHIAVIAGDGIGKEVVPEGIRVLNVAGRRFDFELDWHTFD